MDLTTFLQLPTASISRMMSERGPKVCVFPLNGTRRWYLLEHQPPLEGYLQDYFRATTARLIELCAMLFDHGIHTLLSPLLNNRLFTARGPEYTRETIFGLSRLTEQQNFIEFYDEYEVGVGFYGSYAELLTAEAGEEMQARFQKLIARTAGHGARRIFWGICAENGPEVTAQMGIDFYAQHGRPPSRSDLLHLYYGAEIPPVDLFISAAKPRVFDVPLLLTGTEDLYFTAVPSPYLSQSQLRHILYDHLFARPKNGSKYDHFTSQDWADLRAFYARHREDILGVGSRDNKWGLWHPLPPASSTK